jgi:uncharacterized protein (UPF0332 family)
MSSKDLSKALMRKASNHIKSARSAKAAGNVESSLNNYHRAMLLAGEALLLTLGKNTQDPSTILKHLGSVKIEGEAFPGEALSWLQEIHFLAESNEGSLLKLEDLEDWEDRAQKFLVTVENFLFEIT